MDNDSNLYVNILQEMREEKKQFNEKKLEFFERTYEHEKLRLQHEQERLAYEHEKLRLEQKKEDERIMAIDTAGMPEMLANFYTQSQKEIIERRSKHQQILFVYEFIMLFCADEVYIAG